ncbi:hypothetical protein ACSBOB_19590 [Mesorhizobium sp. ASY16-5R]|uniref:hypothetical protein n=1 Tax=Mesorhizobium sp. ASY16-5R TaxID=3445772 RepID=UPI003F9ED4DC
MLGMMIVKLAKWRIHSQTWPGYDDGAVYCDVEYRTEKDGYIDHAIRDSFILSHPDPKRARDVAVGNRKARVITALISRDGELLIELDGWGQVVSYGSIDGRCAYVKPLPEHHLSDPPRRQPRLSLGHRAPPMTTPLPTTGELIPSQWSMQ